VELVNAVFVGEAMLELSHGGDTLNTAIHMARAGIETAYLTAIGEDPFSSDLPQQWAAEGLDTDFVLHHPVRTTGLYAITTDAKGERSFSYWRDNSAAREMFAIDGIAAATRFPLPRSQSIQSQCLQYRILSDLFSTVQMSAPTLSQLVMPEPVPFGASALRSGKIRFHCEVGRVSAGFSALSPRPPIDRAT
jgi:hypothetical protein